MAPPMSRRSVGLPALLVAVELPESHIPFCAGGKKADLSPPRTRLRSSTMDRSTPASAATSASCQLALW